MSKRQWVLNMFASLIFGITLLSFVWALSRGFFRSHNLGRSLIFSQRSAGGVSPGAVQSIFLRAGLNDGLIDFVQLGNVKNVISNWWTSSDKKVRLSLPAPNRDIGVVLVDVVEDSVLDLGVWIPIKGHGESVMMVRSTIILDSLLRMESRSLCWLLSSVCSTGSSSSHLCWLQLVLRTG